MYKWTCVVQTCVVQDSAVHTRGDCPVGPVVETSLQGARVQSLVGELRSNPGNQDPTYRVGKKKKKKGERKPV